MLRRYFLSTDHKVIGLLYGFTSLFFLLVGFALVLIIRWQPAYPSQPLPLVGGLLVGAFGNYIVPLQLGAPDMAFPRLNLASYWFYATGGAVMLASFFVPGGAANNGWTSYPRCPTSHRATARRCGSAGCCSSSFRRSSAPSTSSRPSCNCTRRGSHGPACRSSSGRVHQAGCDSWHRAASLVHADADGRMGHFRMRASYAIQTQAEYDAWLAKEASFLTGF